MAAYRCYRDFILAYKTVCGDIAPSLSLLGEFCSGPGIFSMAIESYAAVS